MTINLMENVKKMMGWCPNASLTKQKTSFVGYGMESINAGLPVKKWKLDLLIIGHLCALLFASLFILPMSVYQAFDLYNSPYLALNHGQFSADITSSVASALFSIATVMLIYNIAVYKKLYSKFCYFNIILLSGLFVAIILLLSFYGDYRLEWSIDWALALALVPSIPSFLSLRFNKRYGQKLVTEGSGLVELIKHSIGWCPNANPAEHKYIKFDDFARFSQEPAGKPTVEKFQSKNVMFSANTFLFTFCFVIVLNVILSLARNLDYAILIPFLVGIYSLLYIITVKTFKAYISIDENGVDLKYFEMRDVLLNYRDIKSITISKVVNPPKGLIAIGLLLLASIIVALIISSVMSEDWKLTISVVSLLPWLLLVKRKQDREYHNLDTRLYIQYEDKNRRKGWYELTNTSYYQIITDETTASEIQASIEYYRGAN